MAVEIVRLERELFEKIITELHGTRPGSKVMSQFLRAFEKNKLIISQFEKAWPENTLAEQLDKIIGPAAEFQVFFLAVTKKPKLLLDYISNRLHGEVREKCELAVRNYMQLENSLSILRQAQEACEVWKAALSDFVTDKDGNVLNYMEFRTSHPKAFHEDIGGLPALRVLSEFRSKSEFVLNLLNRVEAKAVAESLDASYFFESISQLALAVEMSGISNLAERLENLINIESLTSKRVFDRKAIAVRQENLLHAMVRDVFYGDEKRNIFPYKLTSEAEKTLPKAEVSGDKMAAKYSDPLMNFIDAQEVLEEVIDRSFGILHARIEGLQSSAFNLLDEVTPALTTLEIQNLMEKIRLRDYSQLEQILATAQPSPAKKETEAALQECIKFGSDIKSMALAHVIGNRQVIAFQHALMDDDGDKPLMDVGKFRNKYPKGFDSKLDTEETSQYDNLNQVPTLLEVLASSSKYATMAINSIKSITCREIELWVKGSDWFGAYISFSKRISDSGIEQQAQILDNFLKTSKAGIGR